MKHHLALWLSIPWLSGAQYSHTLPPVPPVVCGVVSAVGGLVFFGAWAVGAVGGTSGVWVSLSRASATTSDHVNVVPCKVTLVFRTVSRSCYIGKSNLVTKQWSVASSFAAIERRSCSTLSTKLAELSLAWGFRPKYLALSWLSESPNSLLTTSLNSAQSSKVWC